MKPREIIIRGDVAIIPLTKGYEAIVDAADAHLVSGVNWSPNPSHKTVYAVRVICHRDGRREKVILHRLLMCAPSGMQVDHRDGDGLNCRRGNMRIATLQQNNLNRGMRVTNKCGFKGVHKQGDAYVASITPPGAKRIYLGRFPAPEQAYAAYCEAGKSLHGEFWRPL